MEARAEVEEKHDDSGGIGWGGAAASSRAKVAQLKKVLERRIADETGATELLDYGLDVFLGGIRG